MADALLDRRVLVDRLVGVVDRIRSLVNGKLGTRPYRVSVVTRRWSGQRVGEGTYQDSILTLEPTPEVVRGGGNRLGPAGMEGANTATLRDVSFTYVESELYPRSLPPGAEVVYMLERTWGGEANTKDQEFFTITDSPKPERGDRPGDRIGWSIKLREVQAFSPVDRIDS